MSENFDKIEESLNFARKYDKELDKWLRVRERKYEKAYIEYKKRQEKYQKEQRKTEARKVPDNIKRLREGKEFSVSLVELKRKGFFEKLKENEM